MCHLVVNGHPPCVPQQSCGVDQSDFYHTRAEGLSTLDVLFSKEWQKWYCACYMFFFKKSSCKYFFVLLEFQFFFFYLWKFGGGTSCTAQYIVQKITVDLALQFGCDFFIKFIKLLS